MGVIAIIVMSLLAQKAAPLTQDEPRKLSDGLRSVEGIAVNDKNEVFLADSGADTIWKWDGKTLAPWRTKAGRPAGMRFDADGNLYVCETKNKRVTRIAPDGTQKSIAETFNGAKFNSPTDLCLDDKGGLYFTDPNYGGDANRTMRIEGVYYVGPGGAPLARIVEDLRRPHGIDIWADLLYVVDVGLPGAAAAPKVANYRVDPARSMAPVGFTPILPVKEPRGPFRMAFGTPSRSSWFFYGISKGVQICPTFGNVDGDVVPFPMSPGAMAVHKDLLYVASGKSFFQVKLRAP